MAKNKAITDANGPAHPVVSKQANIQVIDREIEWHTQYEQEEKTAHFVRHVWQRFVEYEGERH